tara:strand:- start:3289 stop:3519 length:231 start_codon:yes stop_codon:yes gene_type:complete
MKQHSEWVSMEKEQPPTEGWYLVRFAIGELSNKIAMHYRPKRRAWFVESGPCYPWGGKLPMFWLDFKVKEEETKDA